MCVLAIKCSLSCVLSVSSGHVRRSRHLFHTDQVCVRAVWRHGVAPFTPHIIQLLTARLLFLAPHTFVVQAAYTHVTLTLALHYFSLVSCQSMMIIAKAFLVWLLCLLVVFFTHEMFFSSIDCFTFPFPSPTQTFVLCLLL